MEENKNKNKIIPIVMTVIIVLLVIGFFVIKDIIIKNEVNKVSKLLTKNQNIVSMYENTKNKLSEDGEKNIEITLSEELLASSNPILSFLGSKVNLITNIVAKNQNVDATTSLNIGKKEIQKIEFLKEQGTLAFNIPVLKEEYLSITNENLDELMKRFGFITGDNTNNEKFIEDSKQIYAKYYEKLKNAVKNYIVRQNAEIEIGGQKYKTKEYKISLGTLELDDIALEILKELKDDDETIKFLAKAYVESEYYKNTSNPKTADEFAEELKAKILEQYNKIKDKDYINEKIYSNIVVIDLYEYENKTIKTVIRYDKLDTMYIIELDAISDNDKDNVLISTYIKEKNEQLALDVKFEGEAKEDYSAKVTVVINGTSIPLADIKVKNVDSSTKTPRKINSLQPILLNKASDYDIALIKKNFMELIQSISDIKKPEEGSKKYGKGDFELNDPENQVKIVDEYKEKIAEIKIGDKKEDIIAKYGEPGKVEETNAGLEILTWYKDEEKKIVLFSVSIRNGTVGTISTTAHSSMEDNVQISTEIKTEIEDLEPLASKITIPSEIGGEGTMTKEDVIKILGNGYIETYRNVGGYSVLRWYDKNENVIEVGFDSKDRAWCKTNVIADGRESLN